MYRITTFSYGYQIYPSPNLFLGTDFDKWERVAMNMFLLRGQGLNVLIDAGMSKVHAEQSNPIIVRSLGEKGKFVIEQDPLDVLKSRLRIDPEDIHYIIITHFHLDHVCDLPRFPAAKFIISRRGFAEIMAPRHLEMVPEVVFPREVLSYLVNQARDRVVFVEEREEVLPGIEVIFTGGHTLDHQAVKVQTNRGVFFFPGDNIPFYRNLEEQLPPGNPANLTQAFDALKMAARGTWTVVVPHDPKVMQRYPDGEIA